MNNVALVTETDKMPLDRLARIAAALQKQVMRDFGPAWGIEATVAAFPSSAPANYMPVIVRDHVDSDPGIFGFHDDDAGRPYAICKPDALTIGHETLEMLADPTGKRFVGAWYEGRRASILVEVCDPVENEHYYIDGIPVPNFCYPAYYGSSRVPGERYCRLGTLDGPRQVRRGGYYSWRMDDGEWFQKDYFGTGARVVSLGKLEAVNGNWRSAVDKATRARRAA